LGKLFGGLILQWGYKATTIGSGIVEVEYPIAFASTVFAVIPCEEVNGLGTVYTNSIPHIDTLTLTKAQIAIDITSATYNTPNGIYWLALGY